MKASALLRFAAGRAAAPVRAGSRHTAVLTCGARLSSSLTAVHSTPTSALSLSSSRAHRQQRWWREWVGFLIGLTMGTAAIGAGSVALCRSLDTPPYLIPYYLRDVRSRFNHYASVKKRRGGPSYMNVEDFVLALLASPDKTLKHPSVANDLETLFNSFDTNGDGYISFPEFSFLLALLASRQEDVRALFSVVDEENLSSITLEQFANVLRGLTNDETAARALLRRKRSGILVKLFGDEEHPRRCSYEELSAVITQVRTEVWKAEFHLHSPGATNTISAEVFSELLAKHMLGVHLPYYIVENIRKLRREAEEGASGANAHGNRLDISLDDWVQFHRLMLNDERLVEAVELYCASGLPLTRQSFKRVLCAAGTPLPDVTVDVVFCVFDKDGDGTIAVDEFMQLMSNKSRYHYRSEPRVKKSLPARFYECTAAAMADLAS